MPIGYHFTGDTLRDGSPVPPLGEKLVFDGDIKICRSGLHWSERAFDALKYAPGKWLHLVECSEPVESQSDKHVSRERTILKTIDAEHLCRRFAAELALSVGHLWDMPGVVRDYLTTLDESKRAAARAAARDAAWDAAMNAAWDAAWDAAMDAAWGAAGVASWDAACVAAGDAAWVAARAAERAAERAASWAGTVGAARSDFQSRVDAAFAE